MPSPMMALFKGSPSCKLAVRSHRAAQAYLPPGARPGRLAEGRVNYTKTIVCFASSRKAQGRCVAGKEWVSGRPGRWVRPTAPRPPRALPVDAIRYADGRLPRLLDIVEVPCDIPCPKGHQRENHEIDPQGRWQRLGRLSWACLPGWLDRPDTLWSLGDSSSSGLNDRIAETACPQRSLYLVALPQLQLRVGPKRPGAADSRRVVQAVFAYRGVNYRLPVTDPVLERNILPCGDGVHELRDAVACVSLSEPFHGHLYKLVAAVLFEERSR